MLIWVSDAVAPNFKLWNLESDPSQSLRVNVNFKNNGMGDPEVLMIFTRAPVTSFAIQSMIDTMIKNVIKVVVLSEFEEGK